MNFLKIKLLVVAVIMFAASSAFASYSVDFTVDTSSLVGNSGYLELQFNPGLSLGAATAQVSNYASDATIIDAPFITGDVTGALPGTATISNTGAWNDYFQLMTFGNILSFHLDLSGAAGNSFGLSFYGADGVTPLLTSDPAGFATTVDLNATGISVNNLSSQVTATEATPTPIPAAAWLLGSGLMGLVGLRRKEQKG